MIDSASPTALITGGSSGIGYELARCFAQDGYRIILVASGRPALEEARNRLAMEFHGDVTAIPKDLSTHTAAAELYAELETQGIQVDVLVNNAGFGNFGYFAEVDLTKQVALLQVNIVALTELTKLFLGPMLRRRSGRIMNVASTAAYLPGPLMAVYFASKAYVLRFTEALASELEGSGVTATALCPGPTESRFQERAGMQGSRAFKSAVMSSGEVARIGYRGLMRGKRVVVTGWRNRLMVTALWLIPTSVTLRAARWFQEWRSSE